MEEDLKRVTIRDVDVNKYAKVMAFSKMKSINIGELFNRLMEQFLHYNSLEEFESNYHKENSIKENLVIRKHKSLKISKKDLEDANANISFVLIDELTFSEDVTKESFEEYVKEISECKTVIVPDILPKLKLFAKISGASEIVIV